MWPQILERLRAYPDLLTGYTEEALFNGLMSGKDVLFALHHDSEDLIRILVGATVVNQPARKLLWVQFAVGEGIDGFVSIAKDAFHDIARRLGCTDVMVTGRRGWLRKLKDVGFREESTNMVVSVDALGTRQ